MSRHVDQMDSYAPAHALFERIQVQRKPGVSLLRKV